MMEVIILENLKMIIEPKEKYFMQMNEEYLMQFGMKMIRKLSQKASFIFLMVEKKIELEL